MTPLLPFSAAQNERHPCFSAAAHQRFGRLHLPVAALCNIRCGFCDRKYACVNESRPGVTARLLAPAEAADAARRAAAAMPDLSVIGVAGPGDPLANPDATLGVLQLVRETLPQVLLCLSTNGLALPRYADRLAALSVGHVTVTVNAATPATGARVYMQVQDGGRLLSGTAGAALLLERQEQGIRRLKALGVTVKVNTVVVPGVNAEQVPQIAEQAAAWGADLMNCIPLIPVPGTPLGQCPAPGHALMERVRAEAGAFLPQMRHCARCRADACGRLGAGTVLGQVLEPRRLDAAAPLLAAAAY